MFQKAWIPLWVRKIIMSLKNWQCTQQMLLKDLTLLRIMMSLAKYHLYYLYWYDLELTTLDNVFFLDNFLLICSSWLQGDLIPKGHNVLIFSQTKKMLNLIQVSLKLVFDFLFWICSIKQVHLQSCIFCFLPVVNLLVLCSR